jgi:hypothetical protein
MTDYERERGMHETFGGIHVACDRIIGATTAQSPPATASSKPIERTRREAIDDGRPPGGLV